MNPAEPAPAGTVPTRRPAASNAPVMAALACGAACLALAAAAAGAGWATLRPQPGDWRHRVTVGPVGVDVSVPAAWRLATHPVVLRLGAGRTWATPYGPVRWEAGGQPGTWQGTCTPCRVARPEWGGAAVTVPRVAWTATRVYDGAEGTLDIGVPGRAVPARWSLAWGPGGAAVHLSVTDAPLADAYLALAAVVPEAAHATIDGRFDLQMDWQAPHGRPAVVPAVRGFRVAGLGTEALLAAVPACAPAPHGFGRWLPGAVVAAEDQGFVGHAGFDIDALAAAWSANGAQGGVVSGGSTLSQQLAKLVYTGGARTPGRKLRELLYAVELDRTLGKARVLQLYLALAPWGGGTCGAAEAARHHLGRDVARLSPREAAWLATLLRHPDAERARWRPGGPGDAARVDRVLDQMRPSPPARLRAPSPGWRPPGG